MTPIQLGSIDYVIIFTYLIGVITLGLRYSRSKISNIDNYLLAGRRLSLPAFAATLVSTWYGGILGIGEFTYRYGILNWVTQALPYYIFAILFAIFLAPKIQKTKLYTIPDLLYNNFGKSSGIIGTIFIFILVTPAPYIFMVAVLLSSILGIPFWCAFIIGVIFSTFYVFFGGFRSVVKTDILQFILMFLGFLILVFTVIHKYGGLTFLQLNLPNNHITLTGGQSLQYVFVWFFIALWTFVDPSFYQRCYAAKSQNTAKYGILVSVLFWAIFDLLTTISGLYSRAIFSDINPIMAFPKLGELVLPTALRGLFFVGLLATIMSTLDSYSFLSAVTFGRDLIWRLRKKGNMKRYTQIGLIVSIIVSAFLIYFIPSVVKIWYTIGTLFIPGLLLPLLSNFLMRGKMSSRGIFLCMTLSFIGTLTLFIIGINRGSLANPDFLYNLQPFFFGIIISIVIFVIDLLN
ncbi:MAG: hypothetical protein DRP89_01430 [Candidatus Neomarinimicrobiota bacterium]|nr:MAG: hypothetical protein DRP89_01430 [Candidatus Neomarinimicrobiota bacterium]